MRGLLHRFLSAHGKKVSIETNRIFKSSHPIYPQHYIRRQFHQIAINYNQSRYKTIVDKRAGKQSVNLSMKSGRGKWTSMLTPIIGLVFGVIDFHLIREQITLRV